MIVLATLLKIVITKVPKPATIAPAATATNPAIRACSMRSWPRQSFQIMSFHALTDFMSQYPPFASLLPYAGRFNRHGVKVLCAGPALVPQWFICELAFTASRTWDCGTAEGL